MWGLIVWIAGAATAFTLMVESERCSVARVAVYAFFWPAVAVSEVYRENLEIEPETALDWCGTSDPNERKKQGVDDD